MSYQIMIIPDFDKNQSHCGRVQNLGYKAAREGINSAVMRSAVVMQMTWVGAPTIYYGMRLVYVDLPIRIIGEHIHGDRKTKNCYNFTKI